MIETVGQLKRELEKFDDNMELIADDHNRHREGLIIWHVGVDYPDGPSITARCCITVR